MPILNRNEHNEHHTVKISM